MVNQVEVNADLAALKADWSDISQKALAAGVSTGDLIVALLAHTAELTAAHGLPVAATPHIAVIAAAAGVTPPNGGSAEDGKETSAGALSTAPAAGTSPAAGTVA